MSCQPMHINNRQQPQQRAITSTVTQSINNENGNSNSNSNYQSVRMSDRISGGLSNDVNKLNIATTATVASNNMKYNSNGIRQKHNSNNSYDNSMNGNRHNSNSRKGQQQQQHHHHQQQHSQQIDHQLKRLNSNNSDSSSMSGNRSRHSSNSNSIRYNKNVPTCNQHAAVHSGTTPNTTDADDSKTVENENCNDSHSSNSNRYQQHAYNRLKNQQHQHYNSNYHYSNHNHHSHHHNRHQKKSPFVFELSVEDMELCKKAEQTAYAYELCMKPDAQLEACLNYTYFITDQLYQQHANVHMSNLSELKQKQINEWLQSKSKEEQQHYVNLHQQRLQPTNLPPLPIVIQPIVSFSTQAQDTNK